MESTTQTTTTYHLPLTYPLPTYPLPPTYPRSISIPPSLTFTPTTTPVAPAAAATATATDSAAILPDATLPDANDVPQQQQPKDKIKRRRATPAQQQALFTVFKQTHFPSTELRGRLAKDLNMTPRAVQIWFQNRRQAARVKQIKGDAAAAAAAADDAETAAGGSAGSAGSAASGRSGRSEGGPRAVSPPASTAGDEDQEDHDNGLGLAPAAIPSAAAAAAASAAARDTPLSCETGSSSDHSRPIKLAFNTAAFAPLLTPMSPDGDSLTRADYFHTASDNTVRRPSSAEHIHPHHHEDRHQNHSPSHPNKNHNHNHNQHHNTQHQQRPQQPQLPRYQALASISSSSSSSSFNMTAIGAFPPPSPPRLPRARTTAIDVAAAAVPDRLRDLPFWTLPAPFPPRATASGFTTPSA
ncbi:hypothetical protein HDU87_007094 [Geranomyces variabilis]|uniref:Homeobox domain-containing protein n=1 Tax=Geranomyces variabilis TaxID=109894 RepID=A0AAD5XNH1_9FUNG|nr:hypothetical protein HDU87_007094 [Geranomyces variabilis]